MENSMKISDGLKWLVVAATCPCHVPIWIGLLAGTTAGAWLASNMLLAIILSTGLFVASMAWAARGSSPKQVRAEREERSSVALTEHTQQGERPALAASSTPFEPSNADDCPSCAAQGREAQNSRSTLDSAPIKRDYQLWEASHE